jgi:hypothetical protein
MTLEPCEEDKAESQVITMKQLNWLFFSFLFFFFLTWKHVSPFLRDCHFLVTVSLIWASPFFFLSLIFEFHPEEELAKRPGRC